MTKQVFLKDAPSYAEGWYCQIIHEFLEDEGTIYFDGTPYVGLIFKLPSSNYTKDYVIVSINSDMTFIAHENT